MEAHATGEAAALLFRLDADGEAPAEELHRHHSGEHLLRPAESLRLLEDEGLRECLRPPHRLGEATRRAVQVWAGNNGPQLFCTNPARYSDSVTAVLMPEGHDAEALRRTARQRFNVSLGGGLGKLGGNVFRIGHLGDLNEPMLLGALSAVEMSAAHQ